MNSTLNKEVLEVDQFNYLGLVVAASGRIEKNVLYVIALVKEGYKVSGAMKREIKEYGVGNEC